MRYLTLAEALAIAQQVTGIDALTLANASRVDLLDSALHAPQSGSGDTDFVGKVIGESDSCLFWHDVMISRHHDNPLALLGADLDVAEWRLGVDANIFWQPEHTLANDIAHYFVGATSNAHAWCAE